MNKCYYRIVWENYSSDKTPLNAQNLNRMDSAIDEMDNRIISLDSTKFDKSEAQMLVKYIEYDENTGIFKITHYNGASYTIDTLLEKLAINFDYDYQTQRLIIELSDGTIKYVDLSALITQYEFLDSDTVHFTISADGKVTVDIKEGSIKEKHLQPNYLASIKVESAKAESSASAAGEKAKEASNSALLAKSYNDGNTGIREGEDTDNAKYYSEQARQALESLEQSGMVTGVKGNAETAYRKGNVNLTAENIGAITKIKLTNQNLNEILEPNFYYAETGNSVAGKPPGMNAAARFGLCVAQISTGWRIQFLFGGNRKIYTRFFDGTTWESWNLREPVITSAKKNLTTSTTGAWYRLGYVSQKSSFYGEFVLTHTWYNSLPCVSKFIVAVAADNAGGAVKVQEVFFNYKSGKIIKKIRVIYPGAAVNDMNIYIDVFLERPTGSYLDTWFYTLDDSLEAIEWVDGGFEKNPEIPEGNGNYNYNSKEFSFVD